MLDSDARFDALIIGAGFSGLYTLHRLRQLGLRTRVLEMAENVGGTWLYNRYPGSQCAIERIEDSYSFSDEIQQEWVWTETMPAQPEVEAYLNFVADRLDLRRDIQFGTKVIAMTFDEQAADWTLRTEAAERPRHPRDCFPRRNAAVPPPLAEGRCRPCRTAGRRHRDRLDRCPAHPAGCSRSRTAVRVSAFSGLHPAVAGAALRARRAGRAESALRRNPSGPTSPPGWRGAAERLLGAARDARQAAVEGGVTRRPTARHRGGRCDGRAELG